MDQKNIYLIGFMGTGKTAVGRALAARMGRPFVDLDQLIEAQTKKTVSIIFEDEGEPSFRRLESAALEIISKSRNLVVATGGGSVLHPRNREVMRETGYVVALKAELDFIKKRLSGDAARPLIRMAKGEEGTLLNLYEARITYYEGADLTLDTSRMTPEEAAEAIYRSLGN